MRELSGVEQCRHSQQTGSGRVQLTFSGAVGAKPRAAGVDMDNGAVRTA